MHANRRLGAIACLIGVIVSSAGVWLGSAVGWNFEPSAAYVNHGTDAARGGIAIIAIGMAIFIVGAIVALAPQNRR